MMNTRFNPGARGMLLALGVLTASGAAHAHFGDIGVRPNAGGRLETYLVDEAFRGLSPVERVFGADLGSIEFGPFGVDDPGYFTDSLAEGAVVGFNILSPLKKWNGAGFDAGIPETLQVGYFVGTPGEITRFTGAGFVSGFDFATVSGGGFDEHLSYILFGDGGDPSDGVYLLELELTSDSYGPSDPFWIVFNLGLDEEDHDAAIDWVEDNLVPAPGAAGALALLGVAAVRRRRR
jgi:hypothetical protein